LINFIFKGISGLIFILNILREIFNEEQKKGVEDMKAKLSNLKGADLGNFK